MKVLLFTLNAWKKQVTSHVEKKAFPKEQFWRVRNKSSDMIISLFFSPLSMFKDEVIPCGLFKDIACHWAICCQEAVNTFNLKMYFLSCLFYFITLFEKLFMAYFIYFTSPFLHFCFLVITCPYPHSSIKHKHTSFCL